MVTDFVELYRQHFEMMSVKIQRTMGTDLVPVNSPKFEQMALMESVQPQLTMVTDSELTVLMKSENKHMKNERIFLQS